MCKNGHAEEALVFLQELERKNVGLSCSCMMLLLLDCAKKEMVDKGFSPNAHTFQLLINVPSAECSLLDMIQRLRPNDCK